MIQKGPTFRCFTQAHRKDLQRASKTPTMTCKGVSTQLHTCSLLTKLDNVMNILESLCLGFYLLFASFTVQKGTCPIDLAFTMTEGEIIPTHLDTFQSLVTNSKLWIMCHKVPCSNTFELCRTTIIPNQMLFWKTSLVFHITPM